MTESGLSAHSLGKDQPAPYERTSKDSPSEDLARYYIINFVRSFKVTEVVVENTDFTGAI